MSAIDDILDEKLPDIPQIVAECVGYCGKCQEEFIELGKWNETHDARYRMDGGWHQLCDFHAQAIRATLWPSELIRLRSYATAFRSRIDDLGQKIERGENWIIRHPERVSEIEHQMEQFVIRRNQLITDLEHLDKKIKFATDIINGISPFGSP